MTTNIRVTLLVLAPAVILWLLLPLHIMDMQPGSLVFRALPEHFAFLVLLVSPVAAGIYRLVHLRRTRKNPFTDVALLASAALLLMLSISGLRP